MQYHRIEEFPASPCPRYVRNIFQWRELLRRLPHAGGRPRDEPPQGGGALPQGMVRLDRLSNWITCVKDRSLKRRRLQEANVF